MLVGSLWVTDGALLLCPRVEEETAFLRSSSYWGDYPILRTPYRDSSPPRDPRPIHGESFNLDETFPKEAAHSKQLTLDLSVPLAGPYSLK